MLSTGAQHRYLTTHDLLCSRAATAKLASYIKIFEPTFGTQQRSTIPHTFQNRRRCWLWRKTNNQAPALNQNFGLPSTSKLCPMDRYVCWMPTLSYYKLRTETESVCTVRLERFEGGLSRAADTSNIHDVSRAERLLVPTLENGHR